MKIVILGAGLSGLSTAYFLQRRYGFDDIVLLEKEERPGGLCRSIPKGEYVYDIGPHILFSKDKELLDLLLSFLDAKNYLRRSNQIIYKGGYVQYPFENDLSKLPEEDLEYCIRTFNHNPYETYPASNMLQFFLKTFGEGITNCYLRPYNEKIWKYDPCFMNTSMVDRIPKPTKEEIQRSASGETVDGYVHPLYFSYPAYGGIEEVPKGIVSKIDKKGCKIITNSTAKCIKRQGRQFAISDGKNEYVADCLISTIPIQELTSIYQDVPGDIAERVHNLRYNSILIAFLKTPYDLCGDNFTFTIPDKQVLFHRISKMDFLGEAYHRAGEATFIAEITYRAGDAVDCLSRSNLMQLIKDGMKRIGFAHSCDDVEILDITDCKYAYVIYDLNHNENMRFIREFYNGKGVFLNGRFGNFEYWNMDRILRESLNLSQKINLKWGTSL